MEESRAVWGQERSAHKGMCRQMGFSGDLLSEVGPSTATLNSTLVLFT